MFRHSPSGVKPGLPDGIFSDQKFQFNYILEGLGIERFDIFYGIRYILWSLSISCGNFGIFCGI
jgi:hypothetical protein